MKSGLLTTIFCITISLVANAQNKNNLYADVSYSGNSSPGASLIYSHRIVGSFGIGIGAQYLNDNTNHVQKKALSADLRFQWPIGHSLLFVHGGAGLDFHKSYISDMGSVPKINLYTGLGLGYCYLIGKRSMGPYAEVRFWGDGYTTHQYDYVTGISYKGYDITLLPTIAVGFKF